MGRVDNKVAVVSGGSAGTGRAAAVMLAREGAKVALVDKELLFRGVSRIDLIEQDA